MNDPGFRGVSFDQLVAAYTEALRGLVDGEADLILVETVFDTLNCKAALFAIETFFEARGLRLPVMISGTITDASGRTLSGQTTEAFYNSVRHAQPISVGLNCALGAKELRPYVEEMSNVAETYTSVHPNAGLPNAFGEYDDTPENMARQMGEWARSGWLNIAGGCCGTTPEFIRAIAAQVEGVAPRAIPDLPRDMRLSGLEPFNVGEASLFVNVGERTNVTGSKAFARLVLAGDYAGALAVARQQVENGAQVIDVNMDEAMLDSEKPMVTFLNLVASEPDISRVPVMIDSSKWSVIEAGLKCLQGKGIVNSISMKEGRSRIPAPGAPGEEVRRRRGRDGLRRKRPGRYARASHRGLRARLQAAHRNGGLPARGHHLRPEYLRGRDRPGRTRQLRHRLYRGDEVDPRQPAARQDLGRRIELFVLVPRQRRGARSDAHRVPLSAPSARACRWGSSTPASSASTRKSRPS